MKLMKHEYVILIWFAIVIGAALFSLKPFRSEDIKNVHLYWRPITAHFVYDTSYDTRYHRTYIDRHEVIDSFVWDTIK